MKPHQRILEEQRRQDEKRRVKRAANRKSASTSRARKKALVDDMTAKNERMKQHALILSMLPDLVLAVCRSGEMTYVSPAAQWLLRHSPDEVTGANIFELVTQDCYALLRKMISDNLARPVQSRGSSNMSSEESGPHSCYSSPASVGGGMSLSREVQRSITSSTVRNHRNGVQQRYLQGQAASTGPSDGSGGGGCVDRASGGMRGGAGGVNTPLSHGPKMLRLIRRDKTTVWCETHLSVRTARSESSNPTPIEIILTLRTVSEGNKTGAGNGLPSNNIRTPTRTAEVARLDDRKQCNGDGNDHDDYVEDDDDGYRCEEEDDESNTSGSGNDSGRIERSTGAGGTKRPSCDGSSSQKLAGNGSRGGESNNIIATDCETDPLTEGREERSLFMKRQRMESMSILNGEDGAQNTSKPGEGDDSSTGGDTGGSTTQEGSGSCSNEADSNGEGSNNGSKWGDACAGELGCNNESQCGDFAESEDGSSASSAGADLANELQNAVQSLILMGGNFSSEGDRGCR